MIVSSRGRIGTPGHQAGERCELLVDNDHRVHVTLRNDTIRRRRTCSKEVIQNTKMSYFDFPRLDHPGRAVQEAMQSNKVSHFDLPRLDHLYLMFKRRYAVQIDESPFKK